MKAFVISLVMLAGCGQAAMTQDPKMNKADHPLVGAIRWDAWHGEKGEPGQVVQKTLTPEKYHYRLPYFAKLTPEGKVIIRGDSQEIMDQEIAYAKAAGIDYWAFVMYEPGTALRLSLDFYLTSSHRQDVKFCLVVEHGRFGSKDTFATICPQLVALMAQPSYQKVLNGRPLLYLGFISEDSVAKNWGTWEAFAAAVATLRAKTKQAGAGDPYIVIMDFSSDYAAKYARKLGADATSAYAMSAGAAEGAPFAECRRKLIAKWDKSATLGVGVVPLVSMGWDPRPRVDTPTPWALPGYPGKGYFITPTPAEAADHLREAMDWVARHADAAAAQAIIIYAWNENDEGGWIVPTLNPDGSANEDRVKALGAAVRQWKKQ